MPDLRTLLHPIKWFHGHADSTPDDWQDPDSYFCPYCGAEATGDSWFTDAQEAYVQQSLSGHVGDLIADELEDVARSISRQGGLTKLSVSGPRRRDKRTASPAL
jgi:hypothetical protein